MNEELNLFSKNLRMYMEMYGYNQTTLSEKLNVSHTSVHDYVMGNKFPRMKKESPSFKGLSKLKN